MYNFTNHSTSETSKVGIKVDISIKIHFFSNIIFEQLSKAHMSDMSKAILKSIRVTDADLYEKKNIYHLKKMQFV